MNDPDEFDQFNALFGVHTLPKFNLDQAWMESAMTPEEGYKLYRGKCREYCDAAIAEDTTLTLVRGHYYCPIWNTWEQHWWTTKPDGTIHDPTRWQFPSAGLGIYEEFDGMCECAECGKEVPETEATFYSRYAFCDSQCACRFVGIA